MYWTNLELGWLEFKANARQQWSKLTHAQVDATMSKREQPSLRVQEVSTWQSKRVEK